MQHWATKTHTHMCTHTYKLCIYDYRELVQNKMLECWLDLHVAKVSVKWAYNHVKNVIAEIVLVGT